MSPLKVIALCDMFANPRVIMFLQLNDGVLIRDNIGLCDFFPWLLCVLYPLANDGNPLLNQLRCTEPIAEARARIAGPGNKEVHVRRRSQVNLKCVVDLPQSMVGGGSENVAVFWYLDGRALDWLGQTGPGRGVQVFFDLAHV